VLEPSEAAAVEHKRQRVARCSTGVRKHLDAGADHVRLGAIGPDFQAGLGALEHPR
jgi:hypothetical protein